MSMTNRQVFAAFARRTSARGDSVRSERTPHGVVLYSYATPIAIFRDDMEAPIFTNVRFSVTTSKQQSQARSEFGMVNIVDGEQFVPMAKLAGADFSLAR